MSSKNSISIKSKRMFLIALILMMLGPVVLYFGQILLAPIITTIGLVLIFKQINFSDDPTYLDDGFNSIDQEQYKQISADKQISFWNLPFSRILTIIIILILAITDAQLFRTPIVDRYNPIGSWQILMGPTLFYPLVFLPLLIALVMIFNLLFTVRKISLIRINGLLLIQEKGLIRRNNNIKLESITNSHFRSNTTGLKALWVIPWSIQIWGNFASAWHYFSNEFTFGTGLFIGPAFLIHSFLYLIIMFLLLFSPEYEYAWESPFQECYLRWFSFGFLKKFPKERFMTFLTENSPLIEESDVNPWNLKRRNYYFGVAIVLFVLLIVSISIPFFFSDIPRIFIFMGAVSSLAIAMKDYRFQKNYSRQFGYVQYRTGNSMPKFMNKKWHHTPLEIMLYISELLQVLSIGVILTTKWRIYPLFSGLVWFDLIGSSIFAITMLFVYLKKKWEIIGEPNRIAQSIGFIALGIGIFLSFVL
jgi:hypothetical protein